MTVLARITDASTNSQMKLKVFGTQNVTQMVPNLRKVKSLVDEDASSLLIDSAMRVIFRSFDTLSKYKSVLDAFNDPETLDRFLEVKQESS